MSCTKSKQCENQNDRLNSVATEETVVHPTTARAPIHTGPVQATSSQNGMIKCLVIRLAILKTIKHY